MYNLDHVRGCLMGLAAGDALGYSLEGLSLAERVKQYPKGIEGYKTVNGYAEISANTQMAMFVANGLMFGATRGHTRGVMAPYVRYIQAALQDWWKTQQFHSLRFGKRSYCWLNKIDQMHVRRGADPICLDVLEGERCGTLALPINPAKGAGSLACCAPIGLFFDPAKTPRRETDRLGAETIALTHGSALAFLPGAALVHMVSGAVYCGGSFLDLVKETIAQLQADFVQEFPQVQQVCEILSRGVTLAGADAPVQTIQLRLGGSSGAEVLALSIYACLTSGGDFAKAIRAAVNISAAPAAAGAVTGSLMGAALGLDHLPREFMEPLELYGMIEELADDMFQGCPMHADTLLFDEQWEQKYVHGEYDL